MSLITEFSEARAADLNVSGGKGASLARSAQELPVPPGVIITAEAYREFLEPLREQIVEALTGDDVDAVAARIQELIRDTPLPGPLLTELEDAMRRTGADQHAVAVRSSGTMEDLPGAAFAGQHDTYLGVRGPDGVAEAVKQCFASLWNAHAMRYRERLQVDHLEAAMAVVVQQMVEVGAEESAGVAFSVDPVRGHMSSVLINAAFGLGETVVGGEHPVDEYILPRPDQEKSDEAGPAGEEVIAEKTTALISVAGGGTRQIELPADQHRRAALTPQQRREVAALAVQAEKHFGFPQDIEWAFAGGALYLLQSRPVTRVAARWTRDESAERFPNPVTPLTWDLVEAGFHASLNHSFALMGLPAFDDKWFAMRDYYIYGNQTAVELYSGRIPTTMFQDVESITAALPEIARRYGWVQELPAAWSRDLDTYLLGIGRLMSEPLEQKSLAEVWEHALEISRLGSEYFLPNIAISLTQRTLYVGLLEMLKMALPEEQAQVVFDRLLASTDTKTAHVNAELWEMSRIILRTPGLREALVSADSSEMADRLRRSKEFPEFSEAFELFLQRHGHRELDFDAYHPTWIEAPGIVLDNLRLLAERQEPEDPMAAHRQKALQTQTELEVLNQAPEELRYLIQEVIRLARAYTQLDDVEHYQTTRLTLPMRRTLRELGGRLVDRGVLDEAMDVFFLPYEPLNAAIAEGTEEALTPLREIAAEHKAGHRRAGENPPDWNYGEQDGDAGQDDDGALWGSAGSPGSVEAPVYVVHGPEDFKDFPAGAVLVARTTNPAWTALFYQASGVITESGGALSHGAVTARELGLPAVMAVRGATGLFRSGQQVRVDGSRGRVTVLQD